MIRVMGFWYFIGGMVVGAVAQGFFFITMGWGRMLEEELSTPPPTGEVKFIEPVSQKEKFEQAKGLKDLLEHE